MSLEEIIIRTSGYSLINLYSHDVTIGNLYAYRQSPEEKTLVFWYVRPDEDSVTVFEEFTEALECYIKDLS